jgi:hypothetical protein
MPSSKLAKLNSEYPLVAAIFRGHERVKIGRGRQWLEQEAFHRVDQNATWYENIAKQTAISLAAVEVTIWLINVIMYAQKNRVHFLDTDATRVIHIISRLDSTREVEKLLRKCE